MLYAAEDSAAALRTRVETLARVHEVDFQQLDVHIIEIDSLRLDRPEHQDRLESTLHVYKPALLVLDPLVRVHSIDENVAGKVSMLLSDPVDRRRIAPLCCVWTRRAKCKRRTQPILSWRPRARRCSCTMMNCTESQPATATAGTGIRRSCGFSITSKRTYRAVSTSTW